MADPEDTCRVYDVDGETIRVHGGEPMSEAGQTALGEIVRAAKAKLDAEDPNLGVRQELIAAGMLARWGIPDEPLIGRRGGVTSGATIKARLKAAIDAAVEALKPEAPDA